MKKSLWKLRRDMPVMASVTTLIVDVLVCVMFALAVGMSSIAGVGVCCVASALVAVMFVLDRSWKAFVYLPLSAGVMWLAGGAGAPWLYLVMATLGAVAIAAGVYARLKCSHTVMLCASALGVVLVCVIGFTLYYFREYSIGELISAAYDYAVGELTALTVMTVEGVMPVLSEESAGLIVRYIAYLSPAIVTVSLVLLSLVTVKLFHSFMRLFRAKGILESETWFVDADLPTAAIYLAAQFVAMLSSSGAGAVYYAAENIALIFAPMLICVGIRTITHKFNASGAPLMRVIWAMVFVMAFFSATSFTVTLTAFIGVWVTVKGKLKIFRQDRD